MAVATITRWKVRSGRLADFLVPVTEAKRIVENLGGKVRIWQPVYGGEAGTVSFVVEPADQAAAAEFSAKLQADGEWQALIQKYIMANDNPTADLVGTALVTELPGV